MGFPDPKGEGPPDRGRELLYRPAGGRSIIRCSVADFEELTKIRFLTHLEFESESTYRRVKKLTLKEQQSEKRRAEREEAAERYRSELARGAVGEVYIAWVDNRYGFGLFAKSPLQRGEYIGEYIGIVRKIPPLFSNLNPYCFRYPLYGGRICHYTVDAEAACNETSFMNHSSNPNCKIETAYSGDLYHLCLRTAKEVQADEQLTFDYGG